MIPAVTSDVLVILAALVVVLAVVFVGILGVVCAIGARKWSEAITAAHNARMNGVQADANIRTMQEATDAIDGLDEHRQRARAQYVPPSEEDIRGEIIRQRGDEQEGDQEFTTLGNEGIEDEPPIPHGGFYRV